MKETLRAIELTSDALIVYGVVWLLVGWLSRVLADARRMRWIVARATPAGWVSSQAAYQINSVTVGTGANLREAIDNARRNEKQAK